MESSPTAFGAPGPTSVVGQLAPGQPFTRDEALAAGVSSWALSRGRFIRVLPGVYVDAETPLTQYVMVRAALKRAPEAIVSGRSAALLWNAVVPPSADVELVLPRDQRLNVRGIREHRPAQRPAWVYRMGMRVTTPAATFVRLAHELDLVDLVAAGDSLVRHTDATPQDLVDAAAESRARRSRLARQAAALVRDDVDSVQETRMRLLILFAGFPEPEVNIVVRTGSGEWEFRLDSGHRRQLVAFEYDGRQHEELDAVAYDEQRRRRLGSRGWTIHSFTAEDIFHNPDQTVDRLAEVHRSAGIPFRRSSAWQRYFPVRRRLAKSA